MSWRTFLCREPVAVVTLVTSLASASVPVMLLAGVSAAHVAVVAGVIGGYSAAAFGFVRSVVTPTAKVALTHADVTALERDVPTLVVPALPSWLDAPP